MHNDAGGVVDTVGVDRTGRVDPAAYAEALRADTALACLQSANHEVGTIQPVDEVAALCREAGVPLHIDAAQTVGRVAVPARWDLLTASARKWGGPAGVGILAVRTGTRWRSPLPEDEHESGRMPGPVSLPLVIAAAAAAAGAQQRDGRGRRTPGGADRSAAARGRRPGARRRDARPRGPGRATPPPRRVLVPLRCRRGADERAGPRRLQRLQRIVMLVVGTDAVARARGHGCPDPRQRPRVPHVRHHRRRRTTVPRRAARHRQRTP